MGICFRTRSSGDTVVLRRKQREDRTPCIGLCFRDKLRNTSAAYTEEEKTEADEDVVSILSRLGTGHHTFKILWFRNQRGGRRQVASNQDRPAPYLNLSTTVGFLVLWDLIPFHGFNYIYSNLKHSI